MKSQSFLITTPDIHSSACFREEAGFTREISADVCRRYIIRFHRYPTGIIVTPI